MSSLADLIAQHKLQPHPEGGWFVETYRAEQSVATEHGARSASTAILFAIDRTSFSAFHRIASDEVWHATGVGVVEVLEISGADGALRTTRVGLAPDAVLQHVVPRHTWFASRVAAGADEFALVGCTVAPGFDFADFELARRADLLQAYPQHATIVTALTRS